jgi:hypothetical protein
MLKSLRSKMCRNRPRSPRGPLPSGSELEQHQSIDVEKMTLAGLLDRWLEATFGEMRVATRNSYRRVRRLHVDPALGGFLAAGLTRTQLSAYYSAKMRGTGSLP